MQGLSPFSNGGPLHAHLAHDLLFMRVVDHEGYNMLLLGPLSAKYHIFEQNMDKCQSVPQTRQVSYAEMRAHIDRVKTSISN